MVHERYVFKRVIKLKSQVIKQYSLKCAKITQRFLSCDLMTKPEEVTVLCSTSCSGIEKIYLNISNKDVC